MASHQFSVRQLMLSCVGLCVGLGGIVIWLRPVEVPIDASSDTLATWLPVAKAFALVIGMAVSCLSIIPLVTKRRPVPILIGMLLGIGVGLFLGSLVAHKRDPGLRYKGATAAQHRTAETIRYGAAAIGAILPIAITMAADRRRPPTANPHETEVARKA